MGVTVTAAAARTGNGRRETGNRWNDGMAGADDGKPAPDLQSVTRGRISTDSDHCSELIDSPALHFDMQSSFFLAQRSFGSFGKFNYNAI